MPSSRGDSNPGFPDHKMCAQSSNDCPKEYSSKGQLRRLFIDFWHNFVPEQTHRIELRRFLHRPLDQIEIALGEQ